MAQRRDIDELQSEIQELFAELWQVPHFAGLRRGFRPHVDAYRTDDPSQLTIVVELAGIDPETVHLDATPRTLVITGHRPRPHAPGRVYHLMEIDYGPFQRSIQFGEDLDVERATAAYRDGLLTIVLPVAERPPGPVEVPIEVTQRGE